MSVMKALPENDPIMISWNKYKATDQFANTKKWAVYPEHVEGSLWAAYLQGRNDALSGLEASAPPLPPVPPRAYVRGGYLYTEAADGRFYPIGDDLYLFVVAGVPQCFIQHAPKAPDASVHELTEDERSRWTFEGRFKAWDVGDSGEWKPLPEYGR